MSDKRPKEEEGASSEGASERGKLIMNSRKEKRVQRKASKMPRRKEMSKVAEGI